MHTFTLSHHLYYNTTAPSSPPARWCHSMSADKAGYNYLKAWTAQCGAWYSCYTIIHQIHTHNTASWYGSIIIWKLIGAESTIRHLNRRHDMTWNWHPIWQAVILGGIETDTPFNKFAPWRQVKTHLTDFFAFQVFIRAPEASFVGQEKVEAIHQTMHWCLDWHTPFISNLGIRRIWIKS